MNICSYVLYVAESYRGLGLSRLFPAMQHGTAHGELALIGNASHDTLLRFEMGHMGETIKVQVDHFEEM
jgi:hypothetical protein